MIDWERISTLRVTKKLIATCLELVDTTIEFYDEKCCKRYQSDVNGESFFSSLQEINPEVASNLKKSLDRLMRRAAETKELASEDDIAGLKQFAIPIIVSGKARGFIAIPVLFVFEPNPRALKEIYRKLKVVGVDVPAIVMSKVPIILPDKTQLLISLLEIIAGEIGDFQEEALIKEREIEKLSRELGRKYDFSRLIGNSPSMRGIFSKLERVIDTDSTVLIMGESGTGKELIARAIHFNSPRKKNEYVVVNCSAFSDTLLESELFGHVKGSFTGAIAEKRGLFEIADKGSFFLDEVADMSSYLQAKLLRVIQEGEYLKVGGTKPKRVDVRIIAATNKDLKSLIQRGEFRDDLYYRLNVVNIFIPPLRERRSDIPILVNYFLSEYCQELGIKKKYINKKALQLLTEFDWPGNIRQLENEIKRVVIFTPEDVVTEANLSWEVADSTDLGGYDVPLQGSLKEIKKNIVEKVERQIITVGLKKTGGNKTRLAKELGISRTDLLRKVAKYQISSGT